MVIYLGADHRGFALKEKLKTFLLNQGYETIDCGAATLESGDDYPDIAAAVSRKVSDNPDNARGVLLCGSGVGVDIVANKIRNVRSVLGLNAKQVAAARQDDAVNVLSIAADFVSEEGVEEMVKAFLTTAFVAEARHVRRLEKITTYEHG